MRPNAVFFLPVAILLGLFAPVTEVFAQERDKPPFRNTPPISQDQRLHNPEQFRERREEMRSRAMERARQADTNHDGAISRQEAERSMPHLSRHFEEVDANGDGVVTQDEVRAFRERRMRQRLERGSGDPRF